MTAHPDNTELHNPPPKWVAYILLLAVVGVVGFVRVRVFTNQTLPIAYAIPLVMCVWLRNKLTLWLMAGAFAVMTMALYLWLIPRIDPSFDDDFTMYLVLLEVLIVAYVCHAVISARNLLEEQNHTLAHQADELFRANDALLRRETELDRERRRFEAVLRTLPIGIAVANSDLTRVQLNPPGASLLGVPVDFNAALAEWAGRWTLFSSDGADLPIADYPLIRAVRRGEIVPGSEIDMLLPDGRRITILISAAPIRDRDGSITGGVCSFSDITPMRHLREQLDRRRQDAEDNSLRKTRFLAAVSHDIRTPASAINLLAELLVRSNADQITPQELSETARELQVTANSLVRLVTDVIEMARYDIGRVELKPTQFSLRDLLDEIWPSVRVGADSKSITLVRDRENEPIRLQADRTKLSRVLQNLLTNAVKFTTRGQVKIELSRDAGGALHVNISDTGPGIAPEHLPMIFDEFFQLRNPERDTSKGTGLGLSISKRLIEAMGGKIEVSSVLGAGSIFTVILPESCIVREGSG